MAKDDPFASFTDMQWYMYHQRNVAYFAAFTARSFDDERLLQLARRLVELTPQLRFGFPGGISDQALRRCISREKVPTLDGLPDRWLGAGSTLYSEPSLPLFRIRYAEPKFAEGERAGFLLVLVSHALVEGADSALLSHSLSAAHATVVSGQGIPLPVRLAAGGLGTLLAGLHLIVGNLFAAHPGPFRAITRTCSRQHLRSLAGSHGVRQRALLFGLVLATLFDSGTPEGKRCVSSAYSSLDEGRRSYRDHFMRMRMRVAVFHNEPDFPRFVRRVDRDLARIESRKSGFNAELNAQGIRTHRRLNRLVPWAYPPQLFQFMPYDVVLAVIPPHWLAGDLSQGLIEPVYAGAALEGANGCVIAPGRTQVSFNFYVQDKLVARAARLDALLAPSVSLRSETID